MMLFVLISFMKAGVRKTLNIVKFVMLFRLKRYPKSKRGKKYQCDAKKFVLVCEKLFDIYCNHPEKRSNQEKQHLLRMTEEDHDIFRHQKGARIGFCSILKVPLTPSDLKFKQRHQMKEPSTSRYVAQSILV